jgi:hypothetical protein
MAKDEGFEPPLRGFGGLRAALTLTPHYWTYRLPIRVDLCSFWLLNYKPKTGYTGGRCRT